MMREIDPSLVVYVIGGLVLVMMSFIVFSFVTDTVRSIHNRKLEEEKKKKEEERERKMRQAS